LSLSRTDIAANNAAGAIHAVPLPPHASHNPEVPEIVDLATPFTHAQRQLAFVAHTAKWMEGFTLATPPHRSRILYMSQSRYGAMAWCNAVPSMHFRVLPISFTCAIQVALRLPLSIISGAGITTCPCTAPCDAYGDHILASCKKLHYLKTPKHDLIEAVVARMCRQAGKTVWWDSKRNRNASLAYSPHWRPDLTLAFGNDDGTHIIIDVVTCSVVALTRGGSADTPLVAADAAEAEKRTKFGRFGVIQPHTLVPFAVEDTMS
jgi:hypothetical protein